MLSRLFPNVYRLSLLSGNGNSVKRDVPVDVPGRQSDDNAHDSDVKRLVQPRGTAHRGDTKINPLTPEDRGPPGVNDCGDESVAFFISVLPRCRRHLSAFRHTLIHSAMPAHAAIPRVALCHVGMFSSGSKSARCLSRAFAAVRSPARRCDRRLGRRNSSTAADVSMPTPPNAPPQTNPATKQKLPAFDYTALVASVCEINQIAVPTKVETAVQADAYTLVLGLRGLDGKTAVHVSWHPDAARVALGSPPPRVHKTENLSFGEQTNAVLRDLILTEASVPTAWERVAVFSFAERPGADPKYKLRVETQGRNSNAILTQCGAAADRGDRSNNAGDKIVACAYQVGDKQTSVRPLSPGFAYSPPPQAPGAVPTGCDVDEFRLLVTNAAATAGAKKHKKKSNDKEEKEPETENNPNPPVANGIVRAFRGVSPALARSLLDDARIAASVGIDDLDENAWQLIHDEFARWSKQTQAMVDAICKANDSDSMDPSNSSKQELGCILKHARWHTKEGQLMPHQRSGETRCDGNTISLADAAASSAAASQNGLFDEYVFARQMPLPPVGVVFASVYGEASDVDVFRREKDRLAQGTKTALKKTKQKTTAFEAQIADAADFEKTKIKADEIMAYLHAYEAGSASMTVYDFETGEPREIEIDPLIGPNQTAEKLYKKARKRKRTAAAVEPLLESARSELRYLEQVEFTLAELDGTNSDDVLALEEISLELVDAKLMKPAGKGAAAAIREETRVQKGGKKGKGKGAVTQQKNKNNKKRVAREAAMSNVRKYVAPSGKEVLVGRNSQGNEAVSLQLGQDQDVWFHVRGAPGAHVILRQQPGELAAAGDLQFAANLAAYHSKLKTGGKVDVSFTSPKFVRKPTGARLGMVTMDKEQVMTGRPDDTQPAEEERASGKKVGDAAW